MAFPPQPSQSPCVRNCCLDDAEVCIGCGRHLQEILGWGAADPGERKAILERAAARRAARPAFFGGGAGASIPGLKAGDGDPDKR